MTTVAAMLVTALADHGVRTVWGVVGNALNRTSPSQAWGFAIAKSTETVRSARHD